MAEQKDRYVLHALYASPVKRGRVEVIEDIVPIYNTEFEIALDKKVNKVYTVPDMTILDFEQKGGRIKFTLPCFENHAVIVLE